MGEAGRDSKEDEDEKEPPGQGHEERPQLPPQALPDRPECRPHGTSRRKHGPGPAPGASEAAWPRVPGKGRTAHPCPEPAVRGLTVSPSRRQLGRPGVTAAAG